MDRKQQPPPPPPPPPPLPPPPPPPSQLMADGTRQVSICCGRAVPVSTPSHELRMYLRPGTTVGEFASMLQEQVDQSLSDAVYSRVAYFVPDLRCAASLETRVSEIFTEGEVVIELVTEEEFSTRPELQSKRRFEVASTAIPGTVSPSPLLSTPSSGGFFFTDSPAFEDVVDPAAAAAAAAAPAPAVPHGPAPRKKRQKKLPSGGEAATAQEEAAPEVVVSVTESGLKLVTNLSCHRCKTRKENCFLCPVNDKHKFCAGCLERHHGFKEMPKTGCPICSRECSCAQCRKKSL